MALSVHSRRGTLSRLPWASGLVFTGFHPRFRSYVLTTLDKPIA